MAKEKKTRFVILGFLMEESLSGYEIGKFIKESTDHFWQESDASIYPTLKLLAQEGLIKSEISYNGKRKKEIFTITRKGKKAFSEWFKRTPDRDIHREEFLLKMFFTDSANEAQMKKHCEEKLKDLKKNYEAFREIECMLRKEFPQKTYWLKTLKIGLAHLELDISLLQGDI